MKFVIKQSKTIEEAVNEALLELRATEDQVEVEIIEHPSKGLFGIIGAKEAVVKVNLTYDPKEEAENFLTRVLDAMKIGAKPEVIIKDDLLSVEIHNVDPSDMGILIGKRGNTLDSLQYLLSLAINKGKSDYLKVLIDVEGYRKKREETLIRLANKMADKAKHSKHPVKLEPMNPYERRIIHFSLQNKSGITTYSEGDEPYRRVVINTK